MYVTCRTCCTRVFWDFQIESLPEDTLDEKFYLKFAQYEIRRGESERYAQSLHNFSFGNLFVRSSINPRTNVSKSVCMLLCNRATAIFKQALARLAKEKSEVLYNAFVSFQKQHGTRYVCIWWYVCMSVYRGMWWYMCVCGGCVSAAKIWRRPSLTNGDSTTKRCVACVCV